MPPKSHIYLYGMLGGEVKSMHPVFVILGQYKIEGFTCLYSNFMQKYEDRIKKFETVLNDLKKGGNMFIMDIAKKYKLEDCNEAMNNFKNLSSQGKSIFIPN